MNISRTSRFDVVPPSPSVAMRALRELALREDVSAAAQPRVADRTSEQRIRSMMRMSDRISDIAQPTA